jgi:hypothetical protein
VAAADRAPWTGDPSKPQAAPAPQRGAPSDAKAAIAERHRRRDAFFKSLSISPFTAAGVDPIAAHVATRAGADDAGLEVDPNTTKPDVVSILLDDTGVLVAPVSGGEAIRVRHRTGDGDAAPGAGDVLAGPRRLIGGDIVALRRFLLVIAGDGGGGDVSVFDPDSPARRSFEGFRWFDPDPNMQIRSILSPIANPDTIKVGTSDGQQKSYCRIGTFDLDLPGAKQTLTALAPSPSIAPGATLFIPFRDATNGHETYANGRYLEIRYEGPGKTHLLDFNRAINPYCNYSPWYSCPIPPKENTLAVPIRAGEMAYPHAP